MEIIVAFAVFAIMSTMVIQILNIISVQRRWNNNFSREIDEQENVLVTNDKLGYDGGNYDGNLTFAFSDGSVLKAGYQMKGTGLNGDVEGLAYFVTEQAEPASGDDGDDGDDGSYGENNDNTGAQTDRVAARITGTKGFDNVTVKQVVNCGKDANGNTVYAIEVCAHASKNMSVDDIPYAMYRIYFYNNGGKGSTPAQIAYAKYLNSSFSADNVAGMINDKNITSDINTGTVSNSPDNPLNMYMVAITGSNGLRIGSPFSKGIGSNNNNNNNNNASETYKRCTQCGRIFRNSDNGCTTESGIFTWSMCKKPSNPYWDPCGDHLEPYTPPVVEQPKPEPDEDDSWDGNGVKFNSKNTTKIIVAFKNDPQLTIDSFGANSSNGVYKANATVGGVDCGPNIYGAFPK